MSTMPDSEQRAGEVAWDVATLFPPQGEWSPDEYLSLTDDIVRLVELTDGQLEVLEMPTRSHQQTVLFLISQLSAWCQHHHAGTALTAPIRVQLRPGMFREPDIVFATTGNLSVVGEAYWTGADMVMEVVSASSKSRRRDLEQKRREYAVAKIREYWIVDPHKATVQVLELSNGDWTA
ncbi:MAG: Uma2 family endonuclease [Aureliella sp.]